MTWGDPGVTYRPIPFELGYLAGDDGSIWSTKSAMPKRRKPSYGCKNRRRLYISFSCQKSKHRVRTRSLPVMVLEAFVGPRPPGMECCHNNGDSLDNRLANLRWDTREGNMADNIRNGVRTGFKKGERHARVKLSKAQVLEVVRRHESREKTSGIASSMGLPRGTVHDITSGYNWGHLTGIPKKHRPKVAKP